jgi:hypothetical protein
MAEEERKPLVEVLFGARQEEQTDTRMNLADAISAWYRAGRAQEAEKAAATPPAASRPRLLRQPWRITGSGSESGT